MTMNMPAVPKALTDEEIQCRIRMWVTAASMGAEDVSMHEYLGWSFEEYIHWIETGERP